MKKNIIEDLERIHSITYGERTLKEQKFFDKILRTLGIKKKEDDPKKADFVGEDVKQFFDTLEKIDNDIKQQSSGNYEYQKEVETIQIGLTLLGYSLPIHGVDGKYGPETASAVQKFKEDNDLEEKEPISEVSFADLMNEITLIQLDDTNYSNVKFDNDQTRYDEVNKALLDDLQKAASAANVVVTITTAKSGHGHRTKSGRRSRHMTNTAVDIAILDGESAKGATNSSNGNPTFRDKGNLVKDALLKLGYTWNIESGNDKAVLWQTNTGGNHYNHLHVSNNSGASPDELDSMVGYSTTGLGSVMTVRDIEVLITKLKAKGVKSEDLKKLIDTVVTGGSAQFTDIDLTTEEGTKKYTEICQKFISTRSSNLLNITGDMLTKGAVNAFQRHGRYVPPELALAQLTAEGGFSKDPNARPIRTKNPFNVGNTDSGKNWFANSVQSGIDRYYDLIAKNYLGKGKTAADLVQNFVNKNDNRYASSETYERDVNTIALQANRLAQSVMMAEDATLMNIPSNISPFK